MKIISKLSIITVAFLGISIASKVNAAGATSSACDTSSSTCDTWEGAIIYDMHEGSGANWNSVDIGSSTSGSNIVIDGVGIEVSAWSDTSGSSDALIVEGSLAGPWNSNNEFGFGVENQDEIDYGNYRNGGYSHSIDNFDGNTTDYDMVLFSFSEEVAMQSATFSWLTGGASNVGNQQVSVVGLNSISGLTSGGSSWSDLVGSAAFVTSDSFQIAQTASVYESDFSMSQTAQYWLVGAYNTVFGANNAFSKNDDGFKLASVAFTKKPTTDGKPPTDVNAPNSFALLLLGGGLMAWRKRKTK